MAADVKALHRRYRALVTERQPWEAAWRDLAKHYLPTRWRSDEDQESARKPVLNTGLVDNVGILDMRTLAAGMQGGMTSPVRPWFKLEFQDQRANEVFEGLQWLDEVSRRMQTALHNSNFYNSIHTLYADIGTFGTGCMIETADEYGLNFQVLRCGEYAVDIDRHNMVDTLFHRSYMTARQIVQEFGEAKVPEMVRKACEFDRSEARTQRFDVIQAIYPREDGNGSRWPVMSVYFMYEGTKGGKPHLLRESGFESFPAFVPRWDISGTDVYGRSPAMDVFSDVRMLQSMGATLLKTIHKIADPPIVADSDMRSTGINIMPGGMNYSDFKGRSTPPVMSVQAVPPQAISAAVEARQDVRQNVHDGLYVDLFKMLIQDNRQGITATEIEARQQEKMVLIGPVVERLHKELFSPIIERTFDLLRQWDYLPDPPAGLEGAPLKVDFISVLAQAQRLVSTSSIDQAMLFASNVGQIMPEVLDNIDPDRLMETYTDALGVNKSILRGKQERDDVRAQRAEQMQKQEQMATQAQGVQNLQGMAAAAQSLGQAPAGPDGMTALEALTGGLGGMRP